MFHNKETFALIDVYLTFILIKCVIHQQRYKTKIIGTRKIFESMEGYKIAAMDKFAI